MFDQQRSLEYKQNFTEDKQCYVKMTFVLITNRMVQILCNKTEIVIMENRFIYLCNSEYISLTLVIYFGAIMFV